jgi:DNA-directed RNA polymerase specialized sigma24 family protein
VPCCRARPVPDAPDTDLVPEAVFALEESTAEVRRVMTALLLMQRLHLTWHLDGYTYAEIAAHTGQKQPAVRKNVSRALETLRTTLGGGER